MLLQWALQVKHLKRFGIIVIFTPSGCLDGSSSREINAITNGLCNKCIWQGNACNDVVNQSRTRWILDNCHLFSNEVDLPKKICETNIGLTIPLMPLDSSILHLNLAIPADFQIPNPEKKLIIFTAFGNEHLRTNAQKDIKGKRFILEAVDRLISQGYPILHFHASKIESKDMKYYQAQADMIVDQLNYGTIGSAAREGMMLAKPVVCHVSKLMRRHFAMHDCPVIDATEDSIYDVLKNLILLTAKERLVIGRSSREWMLKWYDVDVCVDRYEKVTDRLLNQMPLKPESDYLSDSMSQLHLLDQKIPIQGLAKS